MYLCGPFGVCCSWRADFVRYVDVSQTAINLAYKVQSSSVSIAWIYLCKNIMEYLGNSLQISKLKARGGPFDLIVLDPPAFTKARNKKIRSLRPTENNAAAMKLLHVELPAGTRAHVSHFMTFSLKQSLRGCSSAEHYNSNKLKNDKAALFFLGRTRNHYLDTILGNLISFFA